MYSSSVAILAKTGVVGTEVVDAAAGLASRAGVAATFVLFFTGALDWQSLRAQQDAVVRESLPPE